MKNDKYYLGIAEAVSKRSPCLRANYGSVIVRDDRIVSVGFNAPATGVEHCSQCTRHIFKEKHGENYGALCPAIHSEENVIINAGRERCMGATLYLWGTRPAKPCYRCERVIKNAGIVRVVINDE